MQLDPEEQTLSKDAVDWIKNNINDIFHKLTNSYDYSKVEVPAASFMAGTPGAGKTEVSKAIVESFEIPPIRIDADEFRELIPGYDGSNAYIYQNAATTAVQKVLDKTFGKNIPFLLDGTFAYANTVQNLKRAKRHDYKMQIYFVYQDPVLAWQFTKAREKEQGRVVPKEVFINAYFQARHNVQKAKAEFGEDIELSLIIKNIDARNEEAFANVDRIDSLLPKLYNEDELKKLLL